MAYPVPDPYRQAIRGGLALTYTVDALIEGVPIAGATGMKPTGGKITDTSRPGVRRKLDLQLPPTVGLYDLLAPVGVTLTCAARVRYTNLTVINIPMGVFDVDAQSVDESNGQITLTAPDKWVRIQRATFARPYQTVPWRPVVEELAVLIRGALGADEEVVVTATSTATVGLQLEEKDRAGFINKLAKSIGAWVFFDRNGVATIADLPTAGAEADWLVDAGGVLTDLSRTRSREDTRNVVVVESSAPDEEKFATQVVWDNDPSSPTYAGPDPLNHPELAGPFGVSVEHFSTPLEMTNGEAEVTGLTILARVCGLASQASMGQVPNPALDAFDVLDLLPPREEAAVPRTLERHVADTVTHPLEVEGDPAPAQQIEGRSTRVGDTGGDP